MAKKKKLTKAAKQKVVKALETLKSFNDSSVNAHIINLTDMYQVDGSENEVSFTLMYNNMGVAATTDVFLDDVQKGDQLIDSVVNFPLGKNNEVDGKFLKIFSTVSATTVTPVPALLKVDFKIMGGVATRTYNIGPATFDKAGDSFQLNIQIFFFHL